MTNNMARVILILSTATLVACGGGGSSSSSDATQSNEEDIQEVAQEETNTTPTWTKNVFTDDSQFKNKCENPRTGQDADGNNYADTAGSTLEEQHWLRSWNNDTYLWYSEVEDQNPVDFDTPQTYFDVLKTLQTTDSGELRDRFHGSLSTAEYTQTTSGSGDVGYGFEFTSDGTFPRSVYVYLVEPNSPAADANITRGAEILFVDGVDVKNSNTVDVILNGLLPEDVAEEHTFVFKDLGATESRTVTLQADAITSEPVHNTKVLETDTGKVGYLTFNTFGSRTAEKALFDAFTTFQDQEVSDLVIDLRYNGGGFLVTSAQLGYMVAGAELSEGKVFDKLSYNDKYPTVSPTSGNTIQPYPFIDIAVGFSVDSGVALPSVGLDRVFILSSSGTCSASESLINGLRGIDVEVILIGGTTCGKPYGFVPTDNCGTTYFTIQFKGENEKGFGDYADGFAPNNTTSVGSEIVTGCQVEDDLEHLLGDENEAMLQAALNYRENGTCPAVVANRASGNSYNSASDINNDPRMIERKFMKEMRFDTGYIK